MVKSSLSLFHLVLSCSSLKSCGSHLQDGMHMEPCTPPSPSSPWHKTIKQQMPSWSISPSHSSSITNTPSWKTCMVTWPMCELVLLSKRGGRPCQPWHVHMLSHLSLPSCSPNGPPRPAPLPGSPTQPYITPPPPLAFLLLFPFPNAMNGVGLDPNTLDLHHCALAMSSISPWIPGAR